MHVFLILSSAQLLISYHLPQDIELLLAGESITETINIQTIITKLCDENSQFDRVWDRLFFLCASLEAHTVTHAAVLRSLIEHMVIPR